MDIQKDKDFTSLPEIAKLYQACKERDLTIAEREYLKGARDAWQAKAQAVQEWISVEDKEPDCGETVLICWSDSPEVEPEKDYMDIDIDTGALYWSNYNDGDEPSHWMPLPKVIELQEPAND